VPDEVSENLLEFFDYQWGTEPGQVYLATLNKGGEFTQYMLEWPRLRPQIVKHVIAQQGQGKDVYFSPSTFCKPEDTVVFNERGKTAAKRENAIGSHVAWVDIDGYKPNQSQPPDNWLDFAKEKGIPAPTQVVQPSVDSSQHVYWKFEKFTPIDEVESINRGLAAITGADLSGWDANQLLRVPFTTNHGYRNPDPKTGEVRRKEWYKGQVIDARLLGQTDEVVKVNDFSAMARAEQEIVERLAVTLGEVIPIEKVMALGKWSDALYAQFEMSREEAEASSPDKRSGALQKLTYLAAESGMTDDQIYSILDFADRRWEKYVKRSPKIRHKLLSDMIARARAKLGYISLDDLTFAGMLGDTETEIPKIVYSWDEFLSAQFKVEWLIDGVLSTTGYGVMTGQPGVGKTQVGLQFAIGLALGHSNILGWHVSGGPRKGMMFSLEMGKESLKYFAEKIQNQYPGQERDIGKNLSIVPLGKAINILSNEGQVFIDNLLSEYKPDFLYIDSLKKIMSKSLNDDEAIRNMNDILQAIREKHRCAIYVVHHDRKKQNGGKNTDAGDLSDMYGSQYIAAEADFALSFRKTSEKGVIVMDPWKVRLDREPEPTYLQRNENLQFTVKEDFSDEEGDRIRIVGEDRPANSNPDESGPAIRL
jgi:hypothetical protein